MKLLFDLHTHTVASGHAFSTLKENIEEAAAKGLKAMGTSDHYSAMPGSAQPIYFTNFKAIKEKILGVRIFTGMEANIIDLEGKLDEIHVIYTNMENAVTNETQTLQLLPLKKASFHTELKMGIPADVHHEEIMLVPSADEVLNTIIPNYVVGTIYGCLVESYCSEQNARMTAMDASNRNASEMLKALSIQYNRARQAAITQEITEVCSGAKAQKRK